MGGGGTDETSGATGRQQGFHEGVSGAAQDSDGGDVRRVRFAGGAYGALCEVDWPVVIKADGLCAGKGVFVAPNPDAATEFHRAGDGEE